MGDRAAPSKDQPNIAVVVLDTLRKDAFDKHFTWLPGRRFENAWAPSHWTVPVHGSLFTGRYASETGVHAHSPVFDYPKDVLAERLATNGYTTRAFSSNVNIAPPQQFDRGFDEFTGSWRLDAVGEEYFDWGRFADESNRTGFGLYLSGLLSCIKSDSKTFPSLKNGLITKLRDLDMGGAFIDDGAQQAKKWLNSRKFGDTEFLFVNLMEAHSPYLPPRGYRTVKRTDIDSLRAYIDSPNTSRETARQAYDDSVRYLSDVYEEMYRVLTENFDYVITLSDHGELLGEYGAWDHLYGVFPELTRVPLVVDGSKIDGSSDAVVSLLDVHATILNLAGIDHQDSRGRSLLKDPDSMSWLTEYHGLSNIVYDSLKSDGYNPEPFQTELRGIVIPDDFYGHETLDGFETMGTVPGNVSPQDCLSRLADDVDERDVGGYGVNEKLRSHLEALGYG